jgi:hypothetical protein
VEVIVKDTLGIKVGWFDRIVSDEGISIAAMTVSGNYQAKLVAYELAIKIAQGKVTSRNQFAAAKLASRFPNNIFYQIIDKRINGGSQEEFDKLGNKLIECMTAWTEPGNSDITLSGNNQCIANSHGHDLIALANYLLRPRAPILLLTE